jgi:hypothetical protein
MSAGGTKMVVVEFMMKKYHPTFCPGDQNINSTTFGLISSPLSTPRF